VKSLKSPALFFGLGVLVAGAVAIGAWQLIRPSTPAARYETCLAGDYEACLRLAEKFQAEGPDRQADVEYSARVAEAIAAEEARGYLGRCYLRLRGSDTVIRFSGEKADETCVGLKGSEFGGSYDWETAAAQPDGVSVVCTWPYGGLAGEPLTLSVLDSKSDGYGKTVCEQFATSSD
jgi:hypothetical protein